MPIKPILSENQRGTIISLPASATKRSLSAPGELSFQDLRRTVLYWDRIAFPQNNLINLGVPAEIEFLNDAGIAVLPMYQVQMGAVGQLQIDAQNWAFKALSRRNPGQWSISQGENSLATPDTFEKQDFGVDFSLRNSIPVPAADTPLPDVLEFRRQRMDEVGALNEEIDRIASTLATEEVTKAEINDTIESFQRSCQDMVKVAKESRINFDISSWTVRIGLELDVKAAVIFAFAGGAAAYKVEMPELGALVGGALSVFDFKASCGIDVSGNKELKHISASPYKFVASVHGELK